MSDITFKPDDDLDVTEIEGNTDAGIEFVDSWRGSTMEVVDSGRIIVPNHAIKTIVQIAGERELIIEKVD